MAQKMRVHILAKELSVSSKTIVDKCAAEGIDTIKNHMSTLSAGLAATVREWFSEGIHDTTLETTTRVDLAKVKIKPRRKKAVANKAADEAPAEVASSGVATAIAEAPVTTVQEAVIETDAVGASPPVSALPADDGAETVDTITVKALEPTSDDKAPAEEALESETTPPVETTEAPAIGVQEAAAEAPEKSASQEPRKPIQAAGPQHVPAPAKLQGPRVVRYEPIENEVGPPRRSAPARKRVDQPGAGGPQTPASTGDGPPGDRATRRRGRTPTRRGGEGEGASKSSSPSWRDRDLAERRARLDGATGRRISRRRSAQHSGSGAGPSTPLGPKTEATVSEPIRMKDFCAATGIGFMQLFKILRDEHNLLPNINMTLPVDIAQLLALHFGIDLTVIVAKTKLDEIREEFANRERKNNQPRPPVVTMLGHVDHGKTSLLDAIRRTRVVAKEDGGITQHIGAHHVETPHGVVTFVDTPGHEAFTAMRARGADVTDVVVLVVAADDGVMPQTIEAINHAKSAEVPVVVALNKIDLGDQNKIKIYGELAAHGLTPSGDWGGEVDVLETSATTGTGINELVEHLSHLSSILELKADPTLPAQGTVIEAETKPGVGSVARVLVQEGTLRVGAFVVCGNASGKVRALLNDQGQRIKEAGPSLPLEVWGLDEVPSAGDKLYEVANLQRAKEVAEEVRHNRVEANRLQSRKVNTLEEMFQRQESEDIPELNIIVKADVDGSIVALKQILGELPTDEVKLTFRHAGVGAVNDSDVLLASACGGLVVAFRVDAPVAPRKLAERQGVEIRPYRVIYAVAEDIKKALEGLLAPEEKIEQRGVAEVRQVFHLSRGKGIVAGSFVESGVIERAQLARVIRDGVVVREGCKFASLRRFKDDVRQVRAGMECGIRLDGFEDLHVGDKVETYEVVKIPRTL